MKPFLHEVAEKIIAQFDGQLTSIGIVFQNKRAALFFRKYFGELMGKTIWSPKDYDIQSLMKRFTGLHIPDNLSLLFDLYKSFKATASASGSQYLYSFDKFYPLGEIILNDFNLIDSYLVDAKQLFVNIKNLEEIDSAYSFFSEEQREVLRNFWKSFSEERISSEKQKFLQLWNQLPLIYEHFTQHLLKDNMAYEGLMMRSVSEKMKTHQLSLQHETYIFVGFNALNTVEKQLFKYLQNRNKAEFFWDTDAYYQRDFKQESGYFLRDNFKLFQQKTQPFSLPENLQNTPKNIQVIGVPLEVGQAKALPTLLHEFATKNTVRTAIVLADEHLLFPVLHSIPEHIDKLNVTMGYPLSQTTLYSLLELYLKLQLFASKAKNNKQLFYHKDVIAILRHPEIWYRYQEKATQLISEIEKYNTIYLGSDFFLMFEDNELLNLFFSRIDENNGSLLITNVLEILYLLFITKHQNEAEEEITVEDEYLYEVYKKINLLNSIIEAKGETFNVQTAIKLLRQYLSSVKIPFTGEPLEGLQIMGVLETRNLDFDNVIILGMNEGIWSNSERPPSFISENLRYTFGLPMLNYQDSLSAYLFYRLIQRAENVRLMYNSITGYNNSGEMSRFIQQITYEMPWLNIGHKQFKHNLTLIPTTSITVYKNTDIMRKLSRFLIKDGKSASGFSASSVSTYLDCSLRFYFRYIAGIQELTEVEEDINPLLFGNLLHQTIEWIYKDYTQKKGSKVVEKQDFKQLRKSIDFHLNRAFIQHFSKEEPTGTNFNYEGTQLIIREVIRSYINNILKVDYDYAPFEIVALEAKNSYKGSINFIANNTQHRARIQGIIDRVDKKDGVIRVIDYKTGHAEKRFPTIERLFERDTHKRPTAVLQTFLYGWIYKQHLGTVDTPVIPGIYNVRDMEQRDFSPQIRMKTRTVSTPIESTNFDEVLLAMQPHLESLLNEIFDENKPFEQTNNEQNCTYCPYAVICNKE